MEPSDTERCTESLTNFGRDDDALDEALLLDDDWRAALEDPTAVKDGMVSVDAMQYAAFLRWQAGNHEDESPNAPLDPRKSPDISQKNNNTNPSRLEKSGSNMLSTQHDVEDRPLPLCGDSSSQEEVHAWNEELDREMTRLGIQSEDRTIFKRLEHPELKKKDPQLYRLVEQNEEFSRRWLEEYNKTYFMRHGRLSSDPVQAKTEKERWAEVFG
ncbi:hypothetical protein Forpe1208_v010949 [Fusarium oxysporum f. sp. rapae]|uniref:Uncharacterized protein n=1 Tax=Fusarium oxysporum f. sp. rapae TaxID=485398 RepID=A0A8J5NQ64_FUSOX|nr:hypothetical protein Forpe1208_v010949 [Fusarium oxysporum f. sp. rapae]